MELFIQHSIWTNFQSFFYQSKTKSNYVSVKQAHILIKIMEIIHYAKVGKSENYRNKFLVNNLDFSKFDDECCESLSKC